MLDGFDVLVMSFTASGVSATWKLTGSQVGMLLSAGLIGMALGSLFLAPRADRFGRRAIVMTSVFIVSVGMLLSTVAQNYGQLGGFESPHRHRHRGHTRERHPFWSTNIRPTNGAIPPVISIHRVIPIGGTVGGAIAAMLIARSGWRAAFEFGGIVSFAMLPISYFWLPESLDFLVTRQPSGALTKLNRLLTHMHRPTVQMLPPIETTHGTPVRASLRQLFSPELVRSTCLIWTAFFFMMGGYYFVFGWSPQVAGVERPHGATGHHQRRAAEFGRYLRHRDFRIHRPGARAPLAHHLLFAPSRARSWVYSP